MKRTYSHCECEAPHIADWFLLLSTVPGFTKLTRDFLRVCFSVCQCHLLPLALPPCLPACLPRIPSSFHPPQIPGCVFTLALWNIVDLAAGGNGSSLIQGVGGSVAEGALCTDSIKQLNRLFRLRCRKLPDRVNVHSAGRKRSGQVARTSFLS